MHHHTNRGSKLVLTLYPQSLLLFETGFSGTPGWPQTEPGIPTPLASTSQVLGLQLCTTAHSSGLLFDPEAIKARGYRTWEETTLLCSFQL